MSKALILLSGVMFVVGSFCLFVPILTMPDWSPLFGKITLSNIENKVNLLGTGVILSVVGLLILQLITMANMGQRIVDLERRARMAEEQLERIQGIS